MKKLLLLAFSLVCLSSLATAQVLYYPCGDGGELNPDVQLINPSLISIGQNTRQSSNYSNLSGQSGLAVNGDKGTDINTTNNQTKTNAENQPWLEIDLGSKHIVSQVKTWFSSQKLPDGLKGYYIIFSEIPLDNLELNTIISAPYVEYLYIDQPTTNGLSIPTGNKFARYIRLQYEGFGQSTFYEVELFGGPGGGGTIELCGNGLDDDGDCKIDCDDSACMPVILTVETTNPTTPIYSNGSIGIHVHSNYHPLSYSLNNGQTFIPCPEIENTPCVFEGLPEGNYQIQVSNGYCTAIWDKPVVLKAPIGIPKSTCVNGDLESGNFSNWDTAWGTRGTGATNTNTNGTPGSRFAIVGSSIDPIVGIKVPFQGSYCLKIGNSQGTSSTDGQLEQATYKFIADQDNKNFSFNYAMVLEDGRHDPLEINPFFGYDVFYIENGNRISIKNFKINADPSNKEYFESITNTSGTIVYKGWTCVTVDLSEYIGKEIFAEFSTAECAPGPHFSYAYIDGLCLNPADNKPIPVLSSFIGKYCKNQEIIADGEGSTSFNKYRWKVCKYDNGGNPVDCVEGDITNSYLSPKIDIKQFYSSIGLFCGNRYQVTLTLFNDCTNPESITKVFDYLCSENIVDYKDILFCNSLREIDVKIEGNNDCIGCPLKWEPSSFLDNQNSQFPTILGTANVLAFNQKYKITTTNSEGCVYRDTVESQYYDIKASTKLVDNCQYQSEIAINGTKLLKSEYFNVLYTTISDGTSSEGVVVMENNGKILYNSAGGVFKVDFKPLKATVSVSMPLSEFVIIGNCVDEEFIFSYENPDRFVGPFDFLMPDAFTPFDYNGHNDTFGPLERGYNLGPNQVNAYWARLEIWNRWGGMIYEQEITNEPLFGTFLDLASLYWDGTVNGAEAPIDVYIWRLDFRNCTYTESTTCDPVCDYNKIPCGCSHFIGEVTIVVRPPE